MTPPVGPVSRRVGAGFSRPITRVVIAAAATRDAALAGDARPAGIPARAWRRATTWISRARSRAPAPRRSLSGTWEFAKGGAEGFRRMGRRRCRRMASRNTSCRSPPKGARPSSRTSRRSASRRCRRRSPTIRCPGAIRRIPRIVLHNSHTEQIIETATQVVILYQFNKKWRVIWTDGRALPGNPEVPAWAIRDTPPPEARFWGYSVGRWVDDYTFVADSNGFDDRTWLDNAGRPHSDALHVIETYHRVDADHLRRRSR